MKGKLSILLLAFVLLALFSCEKLEGPAGKDGQPGKDGNANVKAKIYTNLEFQQLAATSTYQVVIADPDITKDIVDKGAVYTYMSDYVANVTPTYWTQMPGEFLYPQEPTDANYTKYFFSVHYAQGAVTLYTEGKPSYNVNIKVIISASHE